MRPTSLYATVMRRVVFALLTCLLGVTLAVTWQVRDVQDRSARQTVEHIAALVERQVAVEQALNTPAGALGDPLTSLESGVQPGQCAELRAPGAAVQRYCRGVEAGADAPVWFATRWPAPAATRCAVRLHGRAHACVALDSDRAQAAREAWARMLPLLGLTSVSLGLLGVLLLWALKRALQPMRALLDGLHRLTAGQAPGPVARSGVREFDRLAAGFEGLDAALVQRTAERDTLTRRLVQLQEEERRHLARELHDELGQSLAAIQARAVAIAADPATPAASREDALRIERIVAPTMTSLRALLLQLRPPGLGEFGLLGSLRHLVADWNGRGRMRCSLCADGDFDGLPDAVNAGVFRVAQECLTNAARHAAAQDVIVRLRRLPGDAALELVVEDDGPSADAARNPSPGPGLGQIGMHERVAALGGHLAVSPARPRGRCVRAWIPLWPDRATA